jgi:hypothetical protein
MSRYSWGAGFSVDARNEEGNSPPLGASLAAELAKLAGLPYSNESLPIVFQTVRKRVGTAILNDFLKSLYRINSQDEWYSAIAQLTWFRLYTTNIDNLLDRIYIQHPDNQKADYIVCPASPTERDPLFSRLQIVHLHGHVDHLERGVTFTLQEFAEQQASPNPWYQNLVDDLFYRPFIFVGTLLEESTFQHYISLRGHKTAQVRETRPKSYLVSPSIGPIRSESLKDQNIFPIESTGKEFFLALCARLNEIRMDVVSVRHRAFPHLAASIPKERYESVLTSFDPIGINALPNSTRSLPNSFYLGAEPTWRDIKEVRDGARDIVDVIKEDSSRHNNEFHCILLHGPAGCGKTTILKRLAYDFSAQGHIVYFGKGERQVNMEGIVKLSSERNGQERIYVFIDNMTRHLPSLHKAISELIKCARMTLILADRTNAYSTRAHAINELSPLIAHVKDLTEGEVVSIIGCLERFNFLGALLPKTNQQRIDEFMKKASRQLLVAMKETTSGKGFDEILRSEFNDLIPNAKLAYTICCLAVGQGAPGVYRRHLFPCLGKSDIQKSIVISELLDGVLVVANDAKTLLKPRHRVIAYEIANQIAPLGLKVEAISTFLKQISTSIVPNEVRGRGPAFLAYRGLINSDALYTLLGGDREIILGMYQELEPYYKDHYLFWLHYAMAYISQGDLDIGETYLAQAQAICEKVGGNPFQIQNQQGILYLTQASRISPATVALDRAHQGMSLLQSLILNRGDYDSYAYGAYLEYVTRWYAHAGKIVTDNEWEALRRLATEATRKYPLEDAILQVQSKIERAYMFRIVKDKPTYDNI